MNNLINILTLAFNSIFHSIPFGREISVFLISAFPVIELRGGLIAAKILDINLLNAFIICILGNILPVFFVLILIEKIYNRLINSKISIMNKAAKFLDRKVEKNKDKIEKYGISALILFVGIPLPGTGAWTGCILAGLLRLDKKKSFAAIASGVILAGIIMSVISYGIPYLLSISSIYSLA